MFVSFVIYTSVLNLFEKDFNLNQIVIIFKLSNCKSLQLVQSLCHKFFYIHTTAIIIARSRNYCQTV